MGAQEHYLKCHRTVVSMRAVACFILLVTVLANEPNASDAPETPFKFPKNAPNCSFRPDGGEFGISTKGNWMALNWATISEVDSTGKEIRSYDLSVHHFGWSQPEMHDLLDDKKHPTGDRFPGVNFTEHLQNGAWFNVSAWVIDSDANNTNSAVKRDSVKFSIYISNWTFSSTNDSLVVTAGLVGFGGLVRREDNKDKKDDPNVTSTTGVYGSGFLSAPTQALYDGANYGDVTVQHTLKGKPVVTFTFSSFSSNVSYDPTFGTSGNANSGNSLKSSLLVFLSLLFLALIKQL